MDCRPLMNFDGDGHPVKRHPLPPRNSNPIGVQTTDSASNNDSPLSDSVVDPKLFTNLAMQFRLDTGKVHENWILARGKFTSTGSGVPSGRRELAISLGLLLSFSTKNDGALRARALPDQNFPTAILHHPPEVLGVWEVLRLRTKTDKAAYPTHLPTLLGFRF